MVESAVLGCSVWMQRSFPGIADGELRRCWTAAPRRAAFLLVMRRQAADLDSAKCLKSEAVPSDRRMDGDPA